MSNNREIAWRERAEEAATHATQLRADLKAERAAHAETKRQLERVSNDRTLAYVERDEARKQLETTQMHGCACDWSEGIPGPKTRPADAECDYHAGIRRQLAEALAAMSSDGADAVGMNAVLRSELEKAEELVKLAQEVHRGAEERTAQYMADRMQAERERDEAREQLERVRELLTNLLDRAAKGDICESDIADALSAALEESR